MEDEVKVIARIDRKKKVRLYHVLLDDGVTFSEWLRKQIEEYLVKKEAQDSRLKEMTDRREEKRWTDIPNDTVKKTKKPNGKKRKGKEG